MRNLLLVLLFVVAGRALAQAEPRSAAASTGLHPEAGGPTTVGDPVRVASLSVTHQDIDFAVKTSLGDFVLSRTFSGTPDTWEAAWRAPLWFGAGPYHPRDFYVPAAGAPRNMVHWWSSLSGYAVESSVPGNAHTNVPGTCRVSIRDASGDVVASEDIVEAVGLVLQASQGARIVPSRTCPSCPAGRVCDAQTGHCVQPGTPPSGPMGCGVANVYTLVKPGIGRYEFGFVSRDGPSGPLIGTNRRFRLEKFFPDQYAADGSPGTPLYSLTYSSTTPTQVDTISLFDGTQFHVVWAAGEVARVDGPGGTWVSYAYDALNRLSDVWYPATGATLHYDYGGSPCAGHGLACSATLGCCGGYTCGASGICEPSCTISDQPCSTALPCCSGTCGTITTIPSSTGIPTTISACICSPVGTACTIGAACCSSTCTNGVCVNATGIFRVTQGMDGGASRELFTKYVAGPGVHHGPPGSAGYDDPANVSSEQTPDKYLTYTPVSEGVNAVTQNTTGPPVTRSYSTNLGLTRRVDLTCIGRTPLGYPQACSDVANSSSQWVTDNALFEPVDTWQRDYRNAYRVNAYQITCLDPASCASGVSGVQDTEVTRVRAGATDSLGTGALTDTSFTYQYAADGHGTHERLPASSTQTSAYDVSQVAVQSWRYDATTKFLQATFRSGWSQTLTAAGAAPTARTVATFYFDHRACSGDPTRDTLNRTLEVHGPCFVASASATDCDPVLNPGAVPVTQYAYGAALAPNGVAGRLASAVSYAGVAAGAPCLGAAGVVTSYTEYDARGHLLLESDANGVQTRHAWQGDRLTSDAKGTAQTLYFYDASQGGALTSKRLPSGLWESYCYRYGADANCQGGTLTGKLQWKARLSHDALAPPAQSAIGSLVLERSSYTYSGGTPGSGRLFAEASLKTGDASPRRITFHAYDALEREATTGAGDVTVPFPGYNDTFASSALFDENGNRLAAGAPANFPPAACGGLEPDPGPGGYNRASSDLCTRFRYDRLNRVERVDTIAKPSQTPNQLVQTSFTYDAQGNLATVTQDPGGLLVTYKHDDFGNVVTITGQWMRGSVQQEFDARGNLVARQTPAQAPSGGWLMYAYDGANRPLSAKKSSAGEPWLWRYGYDDGVRAPPTDCVAPALAMTLGRVQWKDDSFGRTWYEYDALGNVLKLRKVRDGDSACSAPGTPRTTRPPTPSTPTWRMAGCAT